MGSGASPVLLEMMWLFFMMTNVIISSLVVVVTQFPKDHVLRRKWVPAFCGLGGDADYYGARTLLVFLMQQHMSLPINYVFATLSCWCPRRVDVLCWYCQEEPEIRPRGSANSLNW